MGYVLSFDIIYSSTEIIVLSIMTKPTLYQEQQQQIILSQILTEELSKIKEPKIKLY